MDAVDAEHVRDLVRVGDDGRRAERQHEPRELVDEQLDRLEVHVRVDEAGDDPAARCVEHLACPRTPEARDDAVDDRDVDVQPLPREDREHAAAADDEVGGLVPSGDGEAAGSGRSMGRTLPPRGRSYLEPCRRGCPIFVASTSGSRTRGRSR